MRSLALALALLVSCSWWSDGGAPNQLVLGSIDQGCTSSPDLAGGDPCLRHDWSYGVGGTEQDRFAADAELLFDLALAGVPERVAMIYFEAVRRFGASHWHLTPTRTRGPRSWSGDSEPSCDADQRRDERPSWSLPGLDSPDLFH